MGLLKVVGLSVGPWLVAGGVIAGLSNCSSSSSTTGDQGSSGQSSGSGGSGASGGGSGTSATGSSGSATTGGSGSPSSGTVTNSGSSGSSDDSSDAGPGILSDATFTFGDSGPPVGADGAALALCMSGDTTACGSFQAPTGQILQLGPYGAQMDENMGTGFENPINQYDEPDSGAFCKSFVADFKQAANLSAQLLNTSGAPLPEPLNFALYTVYRPVNWKAGQTVPVLTWGNGTCAQPEGYGALLRYIASYGYFVIAANSRFVGTDAPMLNALNYAAAANKDSTSPYYQKLDLTKVGAWGHSQGGLGTATSAEDPRVQTVLIFNANDSAKKPFLTVSGDTDITGYTPAKMSTAVNAAPAPGAWLYYHYVPDTGDLNGHLTLMLQPERVVGPATAWWEMWFPNGLMPSASAEFLGTSCTLCTPPNGPDGGPPTEWEYGQHNLASVVPSAADASP